MLGGIPAALAACKDFPDKVKVIQIKGITADVEEETWQALNGGAGVFMVDTGRIEDLRRCRTVLETSGRRGEVQLAYAGGVKLTDIPQLTEERLDILCIGKHIRRICKVTAVERTNKDLIRIRIVFNVGFPIIDGCKCHPILPGCVQFCNK